MPTTTSSGIVYRRFRAQWPAWAMTNASVKTTQCSSSASLRAMRVVALLLVLSAFVAGCGGGNDAETASEGPSAQKLRDELGRSTNPDLAEFPTVEGRTLQEVADALDGAGPQAALATSVFRPGENRLAFGLIDDQTGFVYAPTAIYVSRGPNQRAEGPYPAPADLLVTEPAYRSRQAASEDDLFAAIYSAQVPFERPGSYSVLVTTQVEGNLIGAPTEVKVVSERADKVPDVGEPAPRVATETLESASGDIESIETRVPPDSMHEDSLATVLGRKPVAIVFATPQLCESRVCGPVVDIVEQMRATYGDRMTFIHQEVFVDNRPDQGLREPLRAFNLQTEPWLFTIDASGKVAARLEGSFGLDAVESAVKAAL